MLFEYATPTAYKNQEFALIWRRFLGLTICFVVYKTEYFVKLFLESNKFKNSNFASPFGLYERTNLSYYKS